MDDLRPYECFYCNCRFGTQEQLDRHEKKEHIPEKVPSSVIDLEKKRIFIGFIGQAGHTEKVVATNGDILEDFTNNEPTAFNQAVIDETLEDTLEEYIWEDWLETTNFNETWLEFKPEHIPMLKEVIRELEDE